MSDQVNDDNDLRVPYYRYEFNICGETVGSCGEVSVIAENWTEAIVEALAAFCELRDDYREDEDYFLDLRYTDDPVWRKDP